MARRRLGIALRRAGALIGAARRHPWVKALGATAAAAAAAYGLWALLDWLLDPAATGDKAFSQRKDLLTLLFAILGGLVAGLGVWSTWRRVAAAERTVLVAQEAQITERFTRAVELLGSDGLELRLGGIYALERIARDSRPDHWPIMEILTAFVRQRAPWKEGSPDDPDHRTAPDVQAVLTVIGRRSEGRSAEEPHGLDLRGADLRGADLSRAHLERAVLIDTDLEGAFLWDAHLEGAFLIDAHLEGADLSYAHLEGAFLIDAHLERADLSYAHLEGAFLIDAHLERADLTDATGLTVEQVNRAYLDGDTVLPGYLPMDEITGRQAGPPAEA